MSSINEFPLNGHIPADVSVVSPVWGTFATIDELNCASQTSYDPEIENAMHNGWISSHFVSSVLVFSSKCLLEPIFLYFANDSLS